MVSIVRDYNCDRTSYFMHPLGAYVLSTCELPVEVAVLLHHTLWLLFKVLGRVITPPVQHITVLVEITPCKEMLCTEYRRHGTKIIWGFWHPKISVTMHPGFLTIVIETMCDLMSNNHPYSTKVKGLVLLFAEERRLQDSGRKHFRQKQVQSKHSKYTR